MYNIKLFLNFAKIQKVYLSYLNLIILVGEIAHKLPHILERGIYEFHKVIKLIFTCKVSKG